MPGGLKAKIVLPLVGVYLLTIAAGYVLSDLALQGEIRRREDIVRHRQADLEADALHSARALARFQFMASPSLGASTDTQNFQNAADVLGRPFAVIDETGLLKAAGEGADAAGLRKAGPALWELVKTGREGVGNLEMDGRPMRAVWTPVPTATFFRVRDRWVAVLLPAAPKLPDEPAVPTALVWIALGGATLLSAAAYAVSWFWVGRVTALAGRVDTWMPAADVAPAPAAGDEVARLAAAFEQLRVRLEHYQAELVARERLAAVGQVAAMMAHEIRNPLTAMKLSAQMLAAEARDPEAAETLAVILREIGRLQILCDQLLTLSGKRRSVREPVSLSALAEDVCRLLAGQAEQGKVRLTAAAPAGLPALTADGNELRQLLMNLVLNALSASPAGSAVTVESAHQPAVDGKPAAWTLRVIDHGPGIDAAFVKSNRSGLLSNKPGGAGLGLAICEKIVANNAGTLKLINRGDGTTAEVVFSPNPGASDT